MSLIEIRQYRAPDGKLPFNDWLVRRWRMATGRTTGRAHTSAPFRASDYLRDEADIAAYLDAILAEGDPRLVPVALRTIAGAVGGMAALAERTGLSRETLYRTLSEKGNPRLDTLATILEAFGLRIAVAPARKRAIGERC